MIAQDPPSFSKSSLLEKRTHQDFNGENRSGNRSGSGSISNNNKNNNTNKRSRRVYRGNATNEINQDDDAFQKVQMNDNNTNQSSENSEIDSSTKENDVKKFNTFEDPSDRNTETIKENVDTTTNENNHDAEEEEDEEPDWVTIAQHEPANRDVPLFVDARDRREAAETRFAAALDEAHASLKQCSDDLLETAAELYNVQREKLDAMEVQIKQDFVDNEIARSQMQTKLEESASAAQAQFAQLMMRVTQLGKSMGAISASAVTSRHPPNTSMG